MQEALNHHLRFKGRVAIVTGGTRGLGQAYAFDLAKRGAKVIVGGLHAASLDKTVEEIRQMGGEAVAACMNVATIDGGENIVKVAISAFGKVDILINNAGILRLKTFSTVEPEEWNEAIAVNLYGAYHVTRPAFKIMKENRYGRIVMTTSGVGLYGNFAGSSYASAKMGIIGLMNVLKIEGKKYNIKVNAIAPNAGTRMNEQYLPPGFFEKMRPGLVAPLVTYLCSEKCSESGYIYDAGLGLFSRVSIVVGPSIQVRHGNLDPTAEDIMANMDKINSLQGSETIEDLNTYLNDRLGVFQGQFLDKSRKKT